MEAGYDKADSLNLPSLEVMEAFQFLRKCASFTGVELKGTKALRSARPEYGDSAIGRVAVKKEWPICSVVCEVTPEHNVRKKGYRVSLSINEESGEIRSVACDGCKAGTGGCKHVVALIFWLHRRSEEPATTETVCYWKKPRLATALTGHLKASDLSNSTSSSSSISVDSGVFMTKIREKLNADCPMFFSLHPRQSAVALHSLVQECGEESASKFLRFAAAKMAGNCKAAEIATRNQSNSKVWHELRYGRITASKMYEASCCKTADGSFVEAVLGATTFKETPAMKRGLDLEPMVLRKVGETLGLSIQKCGLLLSQDWPAFGASPDGISRDFIFEVKCPSKAVEAYVKDGVVARKVWAQMQTQMFFSGKKSGYLCVADPEFENSKEVKMVLVDFCETECQILFDKCQAFWIANIYPKLL